MNPSVETIRQRLFELRDPDFQAFSAKLVPNVDPSLVIGVRTPALRALAKELDGKAEDFLCALPHTYYEENNLHGFLLERMKDYGALIEALDAFLPYVDNWASCDLISPKVFKKHIPELYAQIPL